MKPAKRDLLVAGPVALVSAARGVTAIVSGSAGDSPKFSKPQLMTGRPAELFGLGYCALALLIISAWLAFSAGHRRAGVIGIVLAVILVLAGFGGSMLARAA